VPLLVAAAVAAAAFSAVADHSVAAFSTSASPLLLQRRGATFLSSSTTAPQQTSDAVLETEAAAAAAAAKAAKSWTDDGFVFGLDGSGLQRPTGRQASLVVDGDSLETTPYQVAVVAGTFAAHAYFAASSFAQMLGVNGGNVAWTVAQALLLTFASWVLADFGSGVLHWSVDNYGNGKTPIMGSIIAAFQGHHSAPWTIAQRGFCNNVHKLCVPFGVVPMTLINFVAGPFTTLFLTMFCVFEIMSQEFHKWSHQLKSEVPGWVNVLQKLGLTIGRKPHAQHHLAPYEGNYCIISGICNDALDKSGFFRRLERTVYEMNGVESNAWKLDPELRARTLRGDYRLVPSKIGTTATK